MCGKQNGGVGFGKGSICVVAVVAALAMLSVGGPAWAAVIIDVEDLEVDNTGDSITSPITVYDVTAYGGGLGAATVWIDYDSSVVDVTGVASGDLGFHIWSDDTPVGGSIYRLIVEAWDASQGHTGNVVVANVTYEAVGGQGTFTDLDLVDGECLLTCYTTYDPIPHTLDDGSFTVVPEPASMVLLASLAVAGVMVLRRRRA